MTVLATVTEDELIRARNVAFTRLLDVYNHEKQQYNKIEQGFPHILDFYANY